NSGGILCIWEASVFKKDNVTKSDNFIDHGKGTDLLVVRRQDLKRQLHGIKLKDTVESIQKSKIRWAIEGDENTKFCHGIINKKRSQLAIRGVLNDGVWQTEPGVVKEAFQKHFEARFKKPISAGLKFNFTFPNRLVQEQADDLEIIVSRDEIRTAVWDCGDNKSSGPDDVLEAFGFGPKWCQWIRGTFSFAEASVLVNRSPSNELSFHCGLKQGDPLALFLFILVMETLHLSFCRVVEAGMFEGIRLGTSLTLSHLFYADDALTLVEWTRDNLHCIIYVLQCFYLASGLQINIHKSQLLGVGVPRLDVETAASSIGCSIMNPQFRYLGVMVGNNMSRHKSRDSVVLKLRTLLSKWKSKTLSVCGRLTLLKSFLGASPLYYMSIFKTPKGILKEMDSIRDGSFSVKEIRNHLDDMFMPSSSAPTRWVKHVPIKINIFAWKARRDCLPTRVNLVRRGITLDSVMCSICNSSEEDAQHVFFRCDVAQAILRHICRWNRLLFDVRPPSRSMIIDDIVLLAFLWCSSRCKRGHPEQLKTLLYHDPEPLKTLPYRVHEQSKNLTYRDLDDRE
nr:RNA-directed DNA polymerase, eukaryota [Tanacetum cinerariifolium]